MKRIIIAAFLLLFAILPATAGNITDLSATFGTIGTSPAICVPAPGLSSTPKTRNTLFIFNTQAASGNIVYWGYSAAIVAAANTAGSTPLTAQNYLWWPSNPPKTPIYCIASGANTQISIQVGD